MSGKLNVLTRLRVVAYRGIEALDTASIFPDGLPQKGVIIRGRTATGKTSVLNAIKAALAAQDIGHDAIRLGHDRAEILIDMNDLTVARVITATRSTLRIDRADAKAIPSPTAWLKTMLGASTFDPIEVAADTAKDKKALKARVLAALPLSVSPEQVATWLDGWTLEAPPDYQLHGLEVVEHVRREFYERRGRENARAKEISKEIDALIAGAPPAVAGAPSVDDAAIAWREAERERGELAARKQRAAEQVTRTQATRDRVARLREEAAALEATPDVDPARKDKAARAIADATTVIAGLEAEEGDIEAQIAALEERLAETRQRRREAEVVSATWERETRAIAAAEDAVAAKRAQGAAAREQADSLEAALANMVEAPPGDEELAAADARIAAAAAEHEKAVAARHRAEHEAKIADAQTRLASAKEAAAQLDAMVTRFTKEIPAQLLREAKGIPGLAIDGDDVYLDDVRLSKLSGREQLLFAVEIARRLNVRSKILIVDGLEKVDDEILPDFVRKATADGYQLIATRVTAEDVHFEAIGPDDADADDETEESEETTT